MKVASPTSLSPLRKQDRFNVHCPIQDVKDRDLRFTDAIEDQVPAMDAAAKSVMFVAWHDGPGFWHVSDVETAAIEFAHETCRTHRVVSGDVVALSLIHISEPTRPY